MAEVRDAVAEGRDQLPIKTLRLSGAWGEVVPRRMDFDGTTFRKPNGIAPQAEWDKASNMMTLYVYIGTRPVIKMMLRPVSTFSDNPWR